MKKTGALILAVLMAAALLTGCGAETEEETVYVQNVGMLCGFSGVGGAERFAGVVSARSEKKITADQSKSIKEILVEAGQEVKTGDVLFTYDMDAAELSLEKAELELEQLNNDLTAQQKQKEQLEKEKAAAPESEKLSYTLQIQTQETTIRETGYSITSKQKEVDTLKKSLEVTEVTSPIDGSVQKVNDPSSSDASEAVIVLQETGNYRIKGYINENNLYSVSQGDSVIIRSRVDNDQIWSGVIAEIDYSSPASNSNSEYYGTTDDGTTSSSKYPFYVDLDSMEGSDGAELLLGQHVYVEPGTADEEETEVIRLNEGYFLDIDGDKAYVWAEDTNGKIEKRQVTLGEYDEVLGEYAVIDGLTADDYIAFPEDDIKAGMTASEFDDSVYEDEDYEDGEEIYDEEYYDEGEEVYDEEYIDESVYEDAEDDMTVGDETEAETSEEAAE